MKKVEKIFINPESKSNQNTPNLSLAYIATYYNVPIIDFNTKPDPFDRIFDYQINILGLSIQSRSYQSAQKIIKKYKERFPEVKIKSLNGPLDVQCCYPFINLEDKIDYPDKFSDNLPFPDYELFDSFNIFLDHWQKNYWSYTIMTSLGCPFSCTYCAAHNRAWLTRSPQNCFEELKQAKARWQIKSFKILDDCFNLKEERVLEFCDLIKKLNIKWSCVNGLRADKFTEKMAKAMQESGCQHIGFGIESIDDEVLKNIKKGESFLQIENAVKIAKKYFKNIVGFFIIGLPGSSYQKDLIGLKWTKKMGLLPQFSFYVPINQEKTTDSLFCGEKTMVYSQEYPQKQQLDIYEKAKKLLNKKRNNIINRIKKKIIKNG